MLNPIEPFEPKSSTIVPLGERWLYQIKWDGVRILTYYDGESVRLFNRRLRERTLHYPELVDIAQYSNAKSVIYDGEVIALGADGKPSFQQVMRRDGIRKMGRVEQVIKTVPINYMIFDVVYYNGVWVNKLPFEKRLTILNETLITNKTVHAITTHNNGNQLMELMKAQGMEGIVAKKRDSPYLIGDKKDYWVKVKNYQDVIAVIGGFTLRAGTINAILLGLYDDTGNFWYIGHSGTGKLTSQDWRNLTTLLMPTVIKDRPFVNIPERQSDAYWVTPNFTAKIQFMEWTSARSLRQPSIQAFVDIPPEQCRFEG